MSTFNYLQEQLDDLKQNNLFRFLQPVEGCQSTEIVINGSKKVCFASNNYLNLANHPAILNAVKKGLELCGYGGGASRLISGSSQAHHNAESALSAFINKEAALLFPNGWMTNEAVIKAIPQKGDMIYIDKLCHSSVIDAAMSGNVNFKTYRKGNLLRLEKLLDTEKCNHKFIITESVFSMDGNCADLAELVRLKKKYNAILIVDEAHSVGCFGKRGAGLSEKLGILDDIDIFIGTLGKAFGLYGGFVASDKKVIDYLINKARPFIYTTALPPINSYAIVTALEIIKEEPQRRENLKENADFLRNKLLAVGINIDESNTHIIPVIIGQEKTTLEIAQKLFNNGFFCPAIRPPTVAAGTSRLRISIQSEHTKDQLNKFAELIITEFFNFKLLKKPF